METMQSNSCCCETDGQEAKSESFENCFNNNTCNNAGQKMSDPDWIKANIEYFPPGFKAENGIFKNISPGDALQMIQGNGRDQNLVVIDVKTEHEFNHKHLSGSRLIDFFSTSFKDDLFDLDKTKTYIMICKVGVRSEIAMKLMEKMGFKEVYNVSGGDERWFAEEIPYP